MKWMIKFLVAIFLFGCASKKEVAPLAIRVNYNWLDSVKRMSDSTYVKKYGTDKFANATYYKNNKEAVVCQVMKDLSDTIRQIIVTKNGKRNFIAEYYSNGQLVANLPLDSFGQYHGQSIYYYQNGFVESEGSYEHGFKKGIWKNYTIEGKLSEKNEYDSNGNVGKVIAN